MQRLEGLVGSGSWAPPNSRLIGLEWQSIPIRTTMAMSDFGMNAPRSGPGRPRDFNLDEALDRAMRLFWRNGYLGTSISDLTEAIGIRRGSLYAAFGSQEELYKKALDRYSAGPSYYQREAVEKPTAYEVVEHVLNGVIESALHPRNPRGCMWVMGLLSCGEPESSVKQDLIARRAGDAERLVKGFKPAVAD